MSLKPSIWQIVNPFFLQDWQDANPSAYTPPYLKTGGASWSGTGLVYDVTALEYYFNGDKLAAATQVTLDASDPTYNRLDAIVVDEAGVVSVIKGDASASPISPSVDESHILVQYILVEAGSTQPTIAKEDIYLENVEWTTSTYTTGAATGSIDFNNAVSPKQGVKCISANADARLGARFVRATSFDPYQYTMLSMWVRFTGSNVAANKSLNVRFENGAGTLVANTINLFSFGLQRNLLNVWQLVVIPITSFGVLPTSVKGLKIIMTGGTVGQARQWDIDLISLTDNSVPSINEQAFNVLKDGALVGQSSTINFKGAPITVTNDPINKKIDVEVTGGGGTPAGSDTQIQYNNAGAFGADAGFTRTSTGVTNISSTFGSSTGQFSISNNLFGVGIKGIATNFSVNSNNYTEAVYDVGGGPRKIIQLLYSDTRKSEVVLEPNNLFLSAKGLTSDVSRISLRDNKSSIFTTISGIDYGFRSEAGVVTIGNLISAHGTYISVDDLNQQITVNNVPTYDDDTAAGTAGLTAGMLYMTTGSGAAPLNVSGILMIKQ